MAPSDLQLALSPDSAYRALVVTPASPGWIAVLARPAFVAFLLGAALCVAATGQVAIATLLETTLAWSPIVIVQLCAAALLIASAPARVVPMPYAVELLFAAHVPWSLWLLAISAAMMLAPSSMSMTIGVAALGAIPFGWNLVLLSAFCRIVLRTSPRGTRARIAAHQAFVWGTAAAYVFVTSAFWPRVLGRIGL